MNATKSISALPAASAAAFDNLAPAYDEQWTESGVGRLQRQVVWRCLEKLFGPGDRVLDLGCGTGVDSVQLARQGIYVLAIDASAEMVARTRKRAAREDLTERISTQHCAIEDLHSLAAGGTFDGVLSNFGALNCVADLELLARDLGRSVRPGGRAVLCFIGRFCLWETIWHLLRMQPAKAFRRTRGRAWASLGDAEGFPVFYPRVKRIRKIFSKYFQVKQVRGVGVFVPPSYLDGLGKRFPRLLNALGFLDRAVSRIPGFRGIADHRLIVLVRR